MLQTWAAAAFIKNHSKSDFNLYDIHIENSEFEISFMWYNKIFLPECFQKLKNECTKYLDTLKMIVILHQTIYLECMIQMKIRFNHAVCIVNDNCNTFSHSISLKKIWLLYINTNTVVLCIDVFDKIYKITVYLKPQNVF